MPEPVGKKPAFPVIGARGAPEDYPGISIRDYLAGQAVSGLVGRYNPADAAKQAYAYADAMLAERDKPLP